MKLKNRGAISNPDGRFEIHQKEIFDDGWENFEEEDLPILETSLMPENAKTLITYNNSPDIGFDRSINPYRGCEHGCIYCYARPAHSYINLSPGIDFETKILYKTDARKILQEDLSKKSYKCETIVLGANTDPYQPAESKLKITREILKVLCDCQHPVSIITKSSLIERDIDILELMAKKNLVSVAISITTLDVKLKRILEPRTSSPAARLRTLKKLTELGLKTRVMSAPMIPMINDMELEEILKRASETGTKHASYVLVRLPHEVKDLFREWLKNHYPDRANHVMSIIQQMRGGKDYDATFGKRMRGEGHFATLLKHRFNIACKRFGLNQINSTSLSVDKFIKPEKPSDQLCLW